MILYCRKCGRIWKYMGSAEIETSCPRCKAYVNLENQRVDRPLGQTGDYSDAKYLGVSAEDTVLYYDETYELVVEFVGEPDPFSRYETHKVPRDQLEEWVRAYHWDVGLRYRLNFKEME